MSHLFFVILFVNWNNFWFCEFFSTCWTIIIFRFGNAYSAWVTNSMTTCSNQWFLSLTKVFGKLTKAGKLTYWSSNFSKHILHVVRRSFSIRRISALWLRVAFICSIWAEYSLFKHWIVLSLFWTADFVSVSWNHRFNQHKCTVCQWIVHYRILSLKGRSKRSI